MSDTGTLHDAFIDELRDTYDAERQLTKALAEAGESGGGATAARGLRIASCGDARSDRRLEQVFETLDEKVRGSTATGSPGSSKKVSRSWKRTSTKTRWTPA